MKYFETEFAAKMNIREEQEHIQHKCIEKQYLDYHEKLRMLNKLNVCTLQRIINDKKLLVHDHANKHEYLDDAHQFGNQAVLRVIHHPPNHVGCD